MKINPDGFGLAWRADDALHHAKYGPDQKDEFIKDLAVLDNTAGLEYVAHFRKATHGAPCVELSHPFAYDDPTGNPVVVFHNGVIRVKTEKDESDTQVFVDRVLARLPVKWWENSALKYLVEKTISPSRMLIMTLDETIRLNDSQWSTSYDVRYSTWPYPKGETPKTTGTASAAAPSFRAEASAVPSNIIRLPATTGTSSCPVGPDAASDAVAKAVAASSKAETVLDESKEAATLFMSAFTRWNHETHDVTPMSLDTDDDGDEYGEVFCLDCNAVGEYVIIAGNSDISITHKPAGASEQEKARATAGIEKLRARLKTVRGPVPRVPDKEIITPMLKKLA